MEANVNGTGDGVAGMRVMVVDDNALLRYLLGLILSNAACQVIEAGSADQALAMAAQTCPDIVFLDISMPGMSGLEAIAPLRARLPRASIVMVSADDHEENLARALQAGAVGFVSKPFHAEAIVRTLRQFGAPSMLKA